MKLKELKEKSQEYDQTEKGIEVNKRLRRVFIDGVICLIFSIIVLVFNIVYKLNWYEYIMPIFLIIAGFIFIWKSIKTKKEAVNIYNYRKTHPKKDNKKS